MKKRVSKAASASLPKPNTQPAVAPITLSVDIGGTGIKMMALDASGKPVSDRFRALTPDDPTPDHVLAVLDDLRAQIPDSTGFLLGFPAWSRVESRSGRTT